MSDDLHWFLALAESRRLTETADAFGTSQPTLTRRLQRLERDLGAPLFDRSKGRLSLNAAGRAFYERARRAQAEWDAGRREVAALSGPAAGEIRLSFLHSFGVRLVPTLISAYRSRVPGVSFSLHQGAADEIVERVQDGRSDLAIVSPRPTGAGTGWFLLERQRLALALPAAHPLAGRGRIDLSEVSDQPFIALQAGFGMRRILEELAAAAGFAARITFESSDLATVLGLVGAGLGVAVVPAEAYPGWADVALVPLAGEQIRREIGLVHHVAAQLPAPAARFADFVRTGAAELVAAAERRPTGERAAGPEAR